MNIYDAFCIAIERIALLAGGSVSWFGCYQPKAPKELKQMLENKKYNKNVDKK